MLKTIIEIVIWILCIYGAFSIIQDYIKFSTYKKIEENIKLIITVKNCENGIEEYIRELTYGRNFYNSLTVIDLDSEDETKKILHKLEEEKYNMNVLDKNEGRIYLNNLI